MPVTSSETLHEISSGEALESDMLPSNEGQAGLMSSCGCKAFLESVHSKETLNTHIFQDHTEKDSGIIKSIRQTQESPISCI